jgi:hypothetical protein
MGRTLATMPVSGEKTVWQSVGITPGVYLYCIKGESLSASGKLVIFKD